MIYHLYRSVGKLIFANEPQLLNASVQKDNCKLVTSNSYVPWDIQLNFTTTSGVNNNVSGIYKYKITYYNTNANIESLASGIFATSDLSNQEIITKKIYQLFIVVELGK
jgi:hypothetical protein